MDIVELKKLKKDIMDIYNSEKDLVNKNNSKLMNEELRHIKNEISKIDSMIEIYQSDNAKYRVMMLERLYMQTLSEMSKEEFNKISVDEEIDIYDNLFPDIWVLSVPFEKKQEYLEEAICNNKPLEKVLQISDGKRKNNGFLKRWNSGVFDEK